MAINGVRHIIIIIIGYENYNFYFIVVLRHKKNAAYVASDVKNEVQYKGKDWGNLLWVKWPLFWVNLTAEYYCTKFYNKLHVEFKKKFLQHKI